MLESIGHTHKPEELIIGSLKRCETELKYSVKNSADDVDCDRDLPDGYSLAPFLGQSTRAQERRRTKY